MEPKAIGRFTKQDGSVHGNWRRLEKPVWNAESLQSQNVYCCHACTGTLGHPDLDLSRSIITGK